MFPLLFLIFLVGQLCTDVGANGDVLGEVIEINYRVPVYMKEAVRFYPMKDLSDSRYALVFSTFCTPEDPNNINELFFKTDCVHIVRLTFNDFVMDTFRVKGFGYYDAAAKSILAVTHNPPPNEVIIHHAVIRMYNGECVVREYKNDADKNKYQTFKRYRSDCTEKKFYDYYIKGALALPRKPPVIVPIL